MKTYSLLGALLFAGLCAGCGGDNHDDKEWTKEELAELEAKWGFEVCEPKEYTVFLSS